LQKIVELAKRVKNPAGESYPKELNAPAKRALYDNLGKDEALALKVDNAVRESRQDDWRSNAVKVRRVRIAIKSVLQDDEALTEQILELVKNQNEY
jgi:type I restriction enzyme R subunit